jgi:hypothetical protein
MIHFLNDDINSQKLITDEKRFLDAHEIIFKNVDKEFIIKNNNSEEIYSSKVSESLMKEFSHKNTIQLLMMDGMKYWKQNDLIVLNE